MLNKVYVLACSPPQNGLSQCFVGALRSFSVVVTTTGVYSLADFWGGHG